KAAVGRFAPLTCPDGPQTQRFFWTITNDKPSLALLHALPEHAGSGLFLLGAVHLNEFWLAKQASLDAALKDLGLTIASLSGPDAASHSTTILREGEMAGGAFAAALVSSNILDRLLISSAGKDLAYGNPFLMPI